jgi:hypothetical protein
MYVPGSAGLIYLVILLVIKWWYGIGHEKEKENEKLVDESQIQRRIL